MRGVLNFSKLMGRTPQGIEPRSDDGPLLLTNIFVDSTSAQESGEMRGWADTSAHTGAPAVANPSQLARAETLKAHLDATLDRMQHARSDADQIFTIIADLEAQLGQMTGLAQANEALSEAVEVERSTAAQLAEKNAELVSELARTTDERNRAREAVEETQKAASALALTNQQEADRNVALAAKLSGLQAELDAAREAREKAEIDCSSLRAGLSERDQALRSLQIKESELRLRADKDASQIAETLQSAERKERRILELGNTIARNAKRIEELEEKGERAREEQRQLE
ncbi:MAG: hypothetical protein AAFO28_03520, partial [Pseudomonadota bacterium]